MLTPELEDLAAWSASPDSVARGLDRLADIDARIVDDPQLARAAAAVMGASRDLTTKLEADPSLLDVLAALDQRPGLVLSSPESLTAWRDREYLRIAARDLLGLDDLVVTVAAISALARDVLAGAHALVAPVDPLAVIGMGKLGGDELNYSSDIDIMFVGDGDVASLERSARKIMELVRGSFRVDANLRPQGRDGPLVRTIASYDAYWERWAEPWEFQALLKARPAAGDAPLGVAFDDAAMARLWTRTFSADDLRSLRHMKARVESELARKGLSDREVKRGRGGLRDIEFSVQLLQLVHGRLDPDLRSPTTLLVLRELADAGYVDPDDSTRLADAYRFFRTVEHRLQLQDGAQVHALPAEEGERRRIARTLGRRDTPAASAVEQLDDELTRQRNIVRSIHERLYFRPLLEAFAQNELLARPGALDARLAAFGFSDGQRTQAAVHELTRGFTRSSRLMAQMLPLLLGWLSDAPDPDLGLLCLRNLAGDARRAEELSRTFRDSPEAARRLCLLIGTSRITSEVLQRNVDLIDRLPSADDLRTQRRDVLVDKATLAVGWRNDLAERQMALRRWKDRNLAGVMARDILGEGDVAQVGRDITALAETALEVALVALEPKIPFAVIALGRFGGAELSYASDLDVVFAYEGDGATDQGEALRLASGLRRFVQGTTPAHRLWEIDVDLRPEGKQGPLARSIGGYRTYFAGWALVWERQAMLRARPVAGDVAAGAAFMALLDDFVWAPGLSDDDQREIRRIKARVERERIPSSEDSQFHLKLGRGSLSDIEWTAQLLQLRHRVPATGTVPALHALRHDELLDVDDVAMLEEAYRFCESTRNRLFLVRSQPGDSLPHDLTLTWLARSLETTPTELRDHYRRVTRRARAVVERVFYGRA